MLLLLVLLAGVSALLPVLLATHGGGIDAGRRNRARAGLAALRMALLDHFADRAAFPASLQAADFLGVDLQPGVAGDAVVDPCGGGSSYRYQVNVSAHVATVYSVDVDGRDDGAAAEALVAVADAHAIGQHRTAARLAVVAAVGQRYVAAGGSLSGDWSQDRLLLGLGPEYAVDGFGQPLQPPLPPGGGP